jgi:hypothetical protein
MSDEIPADYKMLLFEKEVHEPLTDEELEAWKDVKVRLQPPNIEGDPFKDPAFKIAFKLHYELESERIAFQEKFMREVLPKYINLPPSDDLV